uniref:Ion_trans_2 domain-containing protein n=1 Tax=Macrostomum lignano TaxID=282301 RepID=A0A1I8IZX5_9PLAT
MYSNGGFEADMFDGSYQAKSTAQRQPPLKSAAVSTSRFHHAGGVWGFRGFDVETDTAAVVKHNGAPDSSAKAQDAASQSKCRKCCKRFGSIMLSQLGTFVIVIFYVVMGGFLFQYLEIGEPTAMLFKAFYLNICCCKCFIKRKCPEEKAVEESIREQQRQQSSWTTADESGKMPPAKVKDLVVVEEDDEEDDEEEDIVNIPISVTILLLILYILLGAAVFRIWEKWTLIEGTYFSFITLSTIGFGDYVPGKDGPFNSMTVITELLVGALYCFFGLTVLSMCINLIQDEISAKFHWIGLKLGMVKRVEQPSDDESDDESSTDTIMLSHLGTLTLVIIYLIMGGFLFNYLEETNEKSACSIAYSKYEAKRNEATDRVYNIAQGANSSLSKSAILSQLEVFAKDIYTLSVDPTKNCSTIGTVDNPANWVLANAIYFCTTIVTTIGYGHISPTTQWGQIICMIYAILGIPLMLLFLTKIGEPTAMLFRSFYLNICCCKCFVKRRHPAQSAGEQQQTEWRNVEDGGDGQAKQPPPKVGTVLVVEEDDNDDDFDDEVVNIPITVTIMLLILYILVGAAVFTAWEKDWTLVEGTYFSFITLSTIGFGDYVPGRNGPFDDVSVIMELLVGAIYCLFGLAMLSMCMNLIQDEITAKLRWIGNKMGIKTKSSEDEEEDEDESSCCHSDDSSDACSSDEANLPDYNGTNGRSAATRRTGRSRTSTMGKSAKRVTAGQLSARQMSARQVIGDSSA